MNTPLIVLLVAGASVGAFFLIRYLMNRNKGIDGVDWPNQSNGTVELGVKHVQLTPKGAQVFSDKGDVPDSTLALVDAGLDEVFPDAIASGYTAPECLVHSFYDIFIPMYPCVPSPLQGIPSFLLRADNYDGTEYDQYNPKGVGVKDGVGVTFAAEMVISVGTQGSSVLRGQMVCCSDASVMQKATRNGAEHIIIAHNDVDYFVATQTHILRGHPLLPNLTPTLSVTTQMSGEQVIMAAK